MLLQQCLANLLCVKAFLMVLVVLTRLFVLSKIKLVDIQYCKSVEMSQNDILVILSF